MDPLIILVNCAFFLFQPLKGEVVDHARVWVIPAGPEHLAPVGTDVSFSCLVSIPVHDREAFVRWSFNGDGIKQCSWQNLTRPASEAEAMSQPVGSDAALRCNLTISPVQASSAGVYTCYLFDGLERYENSVNLSPVVVLSSETIDILDLSTGDLLDSDSPPICVPSGTERTFQCTVQGTRPGVWSIKWVAGGTEEARGSINETPGASGLVDVSSRFTVFNSRNQGLVKNLTCTATNHKKESLDVSVELRSCPDGPYGESNNVVIVAVISVISTLLVVAMALCAVARFKRNHGTSGSMRSAPDEESSEEVNTASYAVRITPQNLPKYEERITSEESTAMFYTDGDLPHWASRWEISWTDLIVHDDVLGSGNFGEVRSGAVRVGGQMITAAVKMLKGHASLGDRNNFLDEFKTMASIGHHPNIVSLLGACQHFDVLYVALEYLPHGDLRSFLRGVRSQLDSDEGALSSGQLVKFALDVAKGMEHLAAEGVIHRDLAARNVLLGEELIAKVSDFGLSRGEDVYVQTSRTRVPIRWLAPESVRHQVYTSQSDVWSFGILLWEITTLGGTPYPSIETESLAEKLDKGYRMPKPHNCDDQIYVLMRQCWDEDPNSRPTFTDLISVLSEMADNPIKHTYMSVDRVHYVNAICPELDDN